MRCIQPISLSLPRARRTTNEELPSRQEYDTVCLFADVSGFTALSEAMMTSVEGVEGLARHLNSYFEQMVRIIASEGGDVFKVNEIAGQLYSWCRWRASFVRRGDTRRTSQTRPRSCPFCPRSPFLDPGCPTGMLRCLT